MDRGPAVRLLVLWDRECGFCAWMLARVLGWDRRRVLRTAPIQGSLGDRHLGHMGAEQRLESWHAVDAAGHVLSGGAALTEVLRRLPGAGPLAAATARAPRMTQRAYSWVATHRTPLSRLIPGRAKTRARETVARRAA